MGVRKSMIERLKKARLSALRNVNSSIAARLVLSTMGVVLVVSAAGISISYFYSIQHNKAHLEEGIGERIESITSTLEMPVWNSDRAMIDSIARAHLDGVTVTGLRVVDSSGTVLFSQSEEDSGDTVARTGRIIHEGQEIGYVEMTFTAGYFEDAGKQFLLSGFLLVLINLAVVSATVLLLMPRFLRKPIGQINEVAKSYGAGRYDLAQQLEIASEFRPVTSALSRMAKEIQSRVAELRASEERYRTTLGSMLEGGQIIGFDWRYLYLNDTAARHGQRPKQELLGRTMMESYPGIENTEMFTNLRYCMEERVTRRMENLFTYPDGSEGWFDLSFQPVPDGVFILSVDITEHKRTEEKIQQQNEFLNNVLESLTHPFYVIDVNTYQIVTANSAARVDRLLENPTCYAVTHKNSKPCTGAEHLCPLEEVKRTRKPVTVEHIHSDANGHSRNVEVHAYPIFDAGGNVIQMIEYGLDITERKLAEERVIHLTNILRAMRNVNQLITREKDRERLIQRSCDLLVEQRSYEKAWILLMDEEGKAESLAHAGLGGAAAIFAEQITAGHHMQCLKALLTQKERLLVLNQPGLEHGGCVLADAHSVSGVFRCKLEYEGKLYGVLGVTVSATAVIDKEEHDLFMELCDDIAFALANIEREAEHREVEAEIARFKTVSDLATYGITLLDDQHIITYTNKNCAQLHGYTPDELVGQHCTILVPEEQVKTVERLLDKAEITGGFTNEEITHRRKDGTTFPALMTGITVKDDREKIAYTAVTVIDITERKRMEEQLMVTDRLASIGELASGIAHELNNPLTGVIGFADPVTGEGGAP